MEMLQKVWSDAEILERLAVWSTVGAVVTPFLFGVVAVVAQVRAKTLEKRASVALQEAHRREVEQVRAEGLQDRQRLEASLLKQQNKIVSGSGIFEAKLAWGVLGNQGPGTVTMNDWKSRETGNRGYVAIGQGDTPLLVMRSTHVIGESLGPDAVMFQVQLDLATPDSQVRGSLEQVTTAPILQLHIPGVPEGTEVLEGHVELRLNGDIDFEAVVPRQRMDGEVFYVRPVPAGSWRSGGQPN